MPKDLYTVEPDYDHSEVPEPKGEDMNKWIGIAALVILVVLIGFNFSKQGSDQPSSSAPPPSETAPAEHSTPATDSAVATTAADTSCPTPTNAGSGSNQAGLLVTFGDGTSQSVCVAFDDESISGYQLLVDSGLGIITQDFGGSLGQALCKITSGSESDGCDYPNQDCFCDRPTNSWVFFVPDSGQTSWSVSQTSISSTNVSNGRAQAQLWGDDSRSPPSCFFADICTDG